MEWVFLLKELQFLQPDLAKTNKETCDDKVKFNLAISLYTRHG